MKKVKYFYNTNTLRYEKLETPLRVTLLRVIGFISASLVTSLIIAWLLFRNFPSANEEILRTENDKLKQQFLVLDEKTRQLNQKMMELEKRDNEVYRTIFEATPIPDSVRLKEMEQQKEIDLVMSLTSNQLENSVTGTINRLALRMAYQDKSFNEISGFLKNKEKLLAATPAIQPVSNADLKRVASGYGYRIDPVYKTVKFHAGLDFTAHQGTTISAPANGVVKVAGNIGNGYGNHVVLNHGYGYETLYGHMYRLKVKGGQVVRRGEIIGWVGSTGKSTGPHCHYEVHKNGRPLDPVYFFYNDLSPEQFNRLLKMAASANQSFD